MAQISEHINSSNHNIFSYDQMIKMIVNLGSKKCKNNNTFTCQLTRIIIVETPEKDLSNVDSETRHE